MPPTESTSLTGKSPKARKRIKPFALFVALAAANGGLVFGWDVAGAGGSFLMTGFNVHFGWTTVYGSPLASEQEIQFAKSMIFGLFGLGAATGALCNSMVVDRAGRRFAIALAASVFLIGAILQAWSIAMPILWAGRLLSGCGAGMFAMCSPLYISETAPEHARGRFTTLFQLFVTFGILLASAANEGLEHCTWGWRISYCGNALFALLILVISSRDLTRSLVTRLLSCCCAAGRIFSFFLPSLG